MDNIIDTIGINTCLLILLVINFVLFLGFIISLIRISSLNKKYNNFMKKLGNGKDIEEDLENYMYKVNKVEEQNAKILGKITSLDKDLTKCIQKVGIVRYNAFQDTGSNLSFALALLDQNNDGVVLNGIYSREMSNIYAKPVEGGKPTYTVSEEEAQAIKKAISMGEINL